MMAQDSITVRLLEGGRIVIPAPFRKALGIEPGDTLIMQLDDGEMRLATRAHCLRRAREILAPYLAGPSMSEELLAERRAVDD